MLNAARGRGRAWERYARLGFRDDVACAHGQRRLRVYPKRRGRLEFAVTSMITAPIHPVISQYNQQGVLVHLLYYCRQHVVHLLQLRPHLRMVWPEPMADMINAKEVAYQKVPRFALGEQREEVGHSLDICAADIAGAV